MNPDGLDVTQVLHDTRTAYLRDIDVKHKTLVSVGANGRWYFEWIHANCGVPARHIGVELYLPQPDYLPDNCEWIANTAGDMRDIASGVADIVFSGQNIEHLWEDDVAKFMIESNRILKPGGLLIVDSPNRIVTEALCIVHPEHMVELTPEEMNDLLDAAGFEVSLRRGIYLCRDPRNGGFLPYQPEAVMAGPWSLVERCALSDRHVDHAYIWWIEARKVRDEPDEARLRQLVRRYWEAGWPERMGRLQSAFGPGETKDGETCFSCSRGEVGAVIYGPYAPITRGRYRATMKVAKCDDAVSGSMVGIMDVMIGNTVVAQRDIRSEDLSLNEYRPISIEFAAELETSFGMQCRVIANGTIGIAAVRDLELYPVS